MKILVAGDFCPMEKVATLIAAKDYSFFDKIKDVVQDADYSIVNFECPVVVGDVEPIKKCGPALRTISNAVDAIKYAGFNCVTLANNHFRDYGDSGCLTTLDELRKQNIEYVGGGANLDEAQQILYKDIGDKRIAVVNFCENEFSIATATTAGAAPLDAVDNYHQISEARRNADIVLVIVHGGHEYYQLPSPRMKKLYRYFVDLGADAVVNHHQHCYSGYEYYKGSPIVYGIGNLCFYDGSKYDSIWNEGYCVEFEFSNSQSLISLHPYVQCNREPIVSLMSDILENKFHEKIYELNTMILDDKSLREAFDNWVVSREKYIMLMFCSYHNRYLNAAAHRGWIPTPIRPVEIGAMLNFISCEAHRDVVIEALNNNLNK